MPFNFRSEWLLISINEWEEFIQNLWELDASALYLILVK